jgi:modification methylase
VVQVYQTVIGVVKHMSKYPEIDAVLAGESEGCIIQGDCLEVMADIPDGCVDAVVTDPPYLNLKGGYDRSNIGGGVAAAKQSHIAVGDQWEATFKWVPEAKRMARLGAIVFCSYHSIAETATAFNPWRKAVLWTWHKRNAPPTGANVPRFTEEYAWGFAKAVGLKWDAIKSSLIDVPKLQAGCIASPERVLDRSGKAAHPTQKPIEVMTRVLMVIPLTSIVFDPFAGSGTTCIAAKKLGLRYVGVEINERYAAIARNRIRDTEKPLFT